MSTRDCKSVRADLTEMSNCVANSLGVKSVRLLSDMVRRTYRWRSFILEMPEKRRSVEDLTELLKKNKLYAVVLYAYV